VVQATRINRIIINCLPMACIRRPHVVIDKTRQVFNSRASWRSERERGHHRLCHPSHPEYGRPEPFIHKIKTSGQIKYKLIGHKNINKGDDTNNIVQ
jgi:hypothetical protein